MLTHYHIDKEGQELQTAPLTIGASAVRPWLPFFCSVYTEE
jgi:hypothetical protein